MQRKANDAIVARTVAIGFVIVLVLTAGSARARDDHVCSTTADTPLEACEAGVTGDGLVQRAICLNISDDQRFCSAGDCVVTKNFSLLEPPDVFARKYYARGVGVILEVEIDPETPAPVTSQLTNCNFDPRCQNLPTP